MKAWEIVSANGPEALTLNDRPSPEPGPGEVRVDVVASCINYRDLTTVENPEPRGIPYPMSCLLYTSPSPRDQRGSRMPSSA